MSETRPNRSASAPLKTAGPTPDHPLSEPRNLPGPGSERETAEGPGEVYVTDTAPFRVTPNMTVKQVIARIDRGAEGLALVVDDECRLLATVTDGDIRRALMAGTDMEETVEKLLHRNSGGAHSTPITAPFGTSAVKLLRLMGEHVIRHVPLLDDRDCLTGLALLSRFVRQPDLPLRAVIMAGGLGTRLRPLTESTPKPMLPVGDRPLLQRVASSHIEDRTAVELAHRGPHRGRARLSRG